MKKSLIIIASALLFAVGAASHERLRYDSTVFAGTGAPVGGPAVVRVEYPPCIKGVREDRCVQLYERGVKRSYQRWLAENGRTEERLAAKVPNSAGAYPACRSRSDDRCQQRAGTRQAHASRAGTRQVRASRAAARSRQAARAERRAAARTSQAARAERRPVARTASVRRPVARTATPRRAVAIPATPRRTATRTAAPSRAAVTPRQARQPRVAAREQVRPAPARQPAAVSPRPTPAPLGTPGI